MLYEAEGKLYEIFDEQQIKETFKKREFVLEYNDGKYPQYIKFQLTQDRCDLIQNYKVGDQVKVAFALQGKPFTNKEGKTIYFTNLNAIKVNPAGNAGGGEDEMSQAGDPGYDPNQDVPQDEEDDEMPF